MARRYLERVNPILRIDDYNTTGMEGPPNEPYKPFYSYLKSVGASSGDSTRAGSHGLGKAAPLATSSLRTIFVSTIFEDAGMVTKSLIQGRSTLMSHSENGNTISGTGYWGNAGENFSAIEAQECEYDWLKREDLGTTINVVGWTNDLKPNWHLHVMGWAAVNFFAAFERKRLELSVNNNVINSENILDIFENQKIKG